LCADAAGDRPRERFFRKGVSNMTTALREQAAGRNIEPLVEPPQPRFPTSKPYRLVSREGHPESTIVDVAGIPVGGEEFVVMAGPCCVEGEESIVETARNVRRLGALMLRGGAYKPRTSPYSFQGHRSEGRGKRRACGS